MLVFFEQYNDDMTSEEMAYFVIAMDNLKKMSER